MLRLVLISIFLFSSCSTNNINRKIASVDLKPNEELLKKWTTDSCPGD